MYNYLINLSEREILKYMENIEMFLNDEQFNKFEINNFSNTIFSELID